MEERSELEILEQELYGINNAVSKIDERLTVIVEAEKLLTSIQTLLTETKTISQNNYNTRYNQITDNVIQIKELAKSIPYADINEFDKDEIIPQGSINYNFTNINYDSLLLSLPKSPPISQEELNSFIKEIESKYSNVLLQLSQFKSYKKKLFLLKEKLSITALACYLSS